VRIQPAISGLRRGVAVREVVGVALATALIWLFAEAETVTQASAATVVRIFAPEGSQRIVEVVEPGFAGTADVLLQGSRSATDRASASLAKGVVVALGSPGAPLLPGEHVIDLRDAIQRSWGPNFPGVVVIGAEPATLRVSVQERATLVDVPIALDLPEVETDGDPLIEPARADLSGPKAVIDRLRAAGPRLLARPGEEEIRTLPQGEARRVDARLALPEGIEGADQVSITPELVAVTLKVRGVIASMQLALAPVHVLIPPPELANWEVSVDPPFLSDLTISGPGWLVERIRAGVLPVKGVVELTSEDLEAGLASARVTFPLLPDTLTVEAPTRDVRLTIRRVERAAAEPDPAQPQED
jgi:hypothetical protein